ncbi:hypothetical protein L1077_14965 [Pseudoalteromonas luteoviolacea]|uniref:hypothetical protein n=1 Tax=Pseudoalteromonas luteoviolacea TaxID=43657 RepID=UPI001F4282A1|nr:hypothetical protein [Pseudoalteromonas luteoviolacea]MCF6440735.1 hypothetical protein [Pseudoalteromonas luteoviolacea]
MMLPVFPTGLSRCYSCSNCLKVIETSSVSQKHFPSVSKFRVLNKFLALPLALLILVMALTYSQNMEHMQHQFRLHPQKNDILFVDNFKLSADPTQVLYPYRIAKITNVDTNNQTLSLILSNLKYGNISRANRDFVVQRYLFSSFFHSKEVQVPINTMFDEEKIITIKRPFDPLDVEDLHNDVEFDKNFEAVPRIR